MARREVTRREVLTGAGAIGAGTLLPFNLQTRRGKPSEAKNIIFCVADGMSVGVPTMVDHLTQLDGGKRSYWSWLTRQPNVVNGLQDTRSLNSLVTDSSAASSSWGCGRQIWNGQVNTFPDGTKLRTLTQILHDAGVRTGLATTATMTHATPAGFSVNSLFRDDEEGIAAEYLKDLSVDVLLGGGARFFDPGKRKDKRDLFKEFSDKGYGLARSRREMLGAVSDRLLGVFSDGHIPYEVDRENDPALFYSVPSLAEMTAVAIDRLKGGPNGFLLQVEGARVDHGAHSNDLAATLYDQIAFENAVKIAVEFALEDGETLVVVTSDHGNGNPGLNGAGAEYIESTAGLRLVQRMKASYGPILDAAGKDRSPDTLRDVVKTLLGVELTETEAATVTSAMRGDSPFKASIFHGSVAATLGLALGNHTKVTWTSNNHTSDHVLVTALGPGSENFSGTIQNTTVFDVLLGLKGQSHSNPTMSFEEAAKAYEKLRGGGEGTPHWI